MAHELGNCSSFRRCCCLLPEHRHGAGGHNFEHAPAKTRQVSVRLLTNALHAHLLDHDSSIVVYWYSFSNPCTLVRSLGFCLVLEIP